MLFQLVLMIAMAVAMVSSGTVPIKIRVERDAQGFQGINKPLTRLPSVPRTPVRSSYDPNRRKAVQEFNNFQAGKPGPNNRYAQHIKNGGSCYWCY